VNGGGVEKFWVELGARTDHLAQRLYEFNVLPARNAHPSFLTRFVADRAVLNALRTIDAPMRILSERLRADPLPPPCWDFSDSRLQLAAMPQSALERLLAYVGSAICRNRIAHEIGGRSIRELDERFGCDLYSFAVKRAPIIVGRKEPLPYPVEAAGLAESILATGRRTFEACFRDAPDGFLARFELLFPSDWKWEWRRTVEQSTTDAAWRLIIRIATREVDQNS
jgi:YOP protein translocation protein YscK